MIGRERKENEEKVGVLTKSQFTRLQVLYSTTGSPSYMSITVTVTYQLNYKDLLGKKWSITEAKK